MSEDQKPTTPVPATALGDRELLNAKQQEMSARWKAHPRKETKRQAVARKRKVDRLLAEAVAEPAPKPKGGWRPGAGRKPDYFKKLGIKPISAHELLQALDIPKIIGDLINDRNAQIRLATLTMLLNRAYGLPKETGELNVTGGVSNATSIRVEFVHAKDGQHLPLPAQDGQLLEGETVVSPKPAPVAAVQPPPPPEPTGNCRFHGDFRLSESGGREICPQCRKDAERQERWLAGLMPGAGLQ
jgi:hypothetical protein